MASFFKPVTSIISSRQESSTFITVNSSNLVFSLCDRTNTTNKNSNYFVSFNLPATNLAFLSGSTLATSHPELFQVNVDKIITIPIPDGFYDELIDGRSITLIVPQLSGVTGMSSKTIVSSTYSTLQTKDSSILLGNNIAFLFSDNINLPYSGRTSGGAYSNSGNTTWNTTTYLNRPAAVPYSDLLTNDINTDQRPFSSINFATQVTATYPTNTNQGYNYDIPVGFICLDKGFIVLTHPSIVNNIPWSQGQQQITNAPNILSGTNNIYFSSTTISNLNFVDIDISFDTSVVCIGLPGEFYFTTNPSWNLSKNTTEFNAGTNNFDPVYITQIGLYNINQELVAVAKLSEPVQKTFTNLLTFNLNIEV